MRALYALSGYSVRNNVHNGDRTPCKIEAADIRLCQRLLTNLCLTLNLHLMKKTTVIATGVYLLSDVMICFRVFVALCQAAFNLLDIFCRWQLLRINAPADEHITDSCVVVDMFLLDSFGRMRFLACWHLHFERRDNKHSELATCPYEGERHRSR